MVPQESSTDVAREQQSFWRTKNNLVKKFSAQKSS